jgi:FkbM family methyltransferase
MFKIRTLRNDSNEKDFFVFMENIDRDGIILDIGANIGIMTYHLSNSFSNSRVFAFEPMPQNIATLERIIRKYKLENVQLFKVALGNEEGEVEMVMPVEQNVRMQGLSHVIHESITEFNEGIKVKAPLRMLDKIPELTEASEAVTGIKIDVENFEYFVLEGGRELIAKHRPVIYSELWENENRDRCFELVKSLNYSIKVVNGSGLKDYDPAADSTQNFIFTPISA